MKYIAYVILGAFCFILLELMLVFNPTTPVKIAICSIAIIIAIVGSNAISKRFK